MTPRRRVRLRLGRAGVLAAAALFTLAPLAGHADTAAIAVDHQDYAGQSPGGGLPAAPDAYSNDQTATHVAASGGTTTYDAYYHLELDAVPPGATFTGLSVHVALASNKTGANVDTSGNVNTAAAVVEACVLTQPYPKTFSMASPPPADCSKGSAPGTMNPDGSFTFNLAALLPYWGSRGNTGFELTPVATPGATWGLAFDKSQATAQVTYTLPPQATAAPTSTPAASMPPATGGGGGGYYPTYHTAPVTAPLPVAATSTPTPSAPASPAPGGGAGGAAGGNGGSGGSGGSGGGAGAAPATAAAPGGATSHWPWVLGISLALALLLVAVPLARAGRDTFAPLVREVRRHPRAFSATAVVLAWCVTYGAYSASTLQTGSGSGSAGVASASQPSGASGATPGSLAGPTGAAVTATPGATAAPVAGGGGAPVAGGGTSHGTGAGSGSGAAATAAAIQDGPAPLNLFSADQDSGGLTSSTIQLCGHAALTFGPAFNIGASDLNVFWENLDANGGINGRKVVDQHGNPGMEFEDDGYQASKAVAAAATCQSNGAFMIMGGIGFDQIPSVRSWAEANHQLYLYHVAEYRGSQGLRYSYTALPSVEQMGQDFGELVAARHHGTKVGVVYRDSPNWTPGSDAFEQTLKAAGVDCCVTEAVQANQGSYTQAITNLETQGASTVFLWINALESTEFIKQAHQQQYDPQYELFPFNLTLQTLTNGEITSAKPLEGVAAWPAYAAGQYGGNFAQYASDIHEFEAEYHRWDPNANLAGPGGDLLFLAWAGFKQLADMLQACGHNCTRNRMAAVMQDGYHKLVAPNCDVNFAGDDHHHGGRLVDLFVTRTGSTGKVEWYPEQHCVANF